MAEAFLDLAREARHARASFSISPSLEEAETVSEVSEALLQHPVWDDVLARELLQRAQGAFQKWPEGFVGFSATIRCREGDYEIAGDVHVFIGGDVEVNLSHPELRTWAESALRAISNACTPRFFKDGDGRFPITFEPEDGESVGRRVRVHLGGGSWRAYRIDPKGRLRQQEDAGATRRATATYDGFVRTCPGRVVPTRIHVFDWDAINQTPVERADIEDGYRCLNHVWLPTRRRATLANGVSRHVVALELERHVLL